MDCCAALAVELSTGGGAESEVESKRGAEYGGGDEYAGNEYGGGGEL